MWIEQARRQPPFPLALTLSAALHAALILGIIWEIGRHLPTRLPPLHIEYLGNALNNKAIPQHVDALAEVTQSARVEEMPPDREEAVYIPPPAEISEKVPAMDGVASKPPVRAKAKQDTTKEKSVASRPPSHKVVEQPLASPIKREEGGQRTEEAFQPEAILAQPLQLAHNLSQIARLDQQAQEEKRRRQSLNGEATVDMNTLEVRYASYFNGLRQRVEQVWSYPLQAKKANQTGKLRMAITIAKDGQVLGIKLLEPSGISALDDAAIAAVKQAAPFAPLPKEWQLETLHAVTTFEYLIRRLQWG